MQPKLKLYERLQPVAKAVVVVDEYIPEKYQGKLSLFILAGQSNMVGHGEMPESGYRTSPKVFGNNYHWRIATEPVDDPSGQIDFISLDSNVGFSPALAFATALLNQHPDIVIGLIPCARGVSTISEWARSFDDRTLY